MAKASENVFPKILFSEETAPATPSAGQAVVYVDTSDGKLKKKDDAGTVVDLEASGGGTHSGATVKRTTNQTIANSSFVAVAFTAEDEDTDTYHDNATNNTRLTVPATGSYLLTSVLSYDGSAGGDQRGFKFRINGTTYKGGFIGPETGTNPTTTNGTEVLVLTAGDYVEVMAYQNSGGNLDVNYATASIVQL